MDKVRDEGQDLDRSSVSKTSHKFSPSKQYMPSSIFYNVLKALLAPDQKGDSFSTSQISQQLFHLH